MIPILKPPVLSRGDAIGIVAPAGPVRKERLETGLEALEAMGFKPVLGRHVFDRRGYLAGTDKDRAADIMEMFLDPTIKGIIAARGGYGSMRVLEYLDFHAIRSSFKALVGSSDITSIHLAFQRSGLVSFHGPMIEVDPLKGLPSYDAQNLLSVLCHPHPLGIVPVPPDHVPLSPLVPGLAQGRLVGGNLSLIVSSLGTDYEIDTGGAILLIEEVGERPYRIDRMLTHLKMAGKLQAASGIVVGDLTRCDPLDGDRSLGPREVLEDVLGPLGKPCIVGLPFGHGDFKATLPLGVEAVVDADKGYLNITESALGC